LHSFETDKKKGTREKKEGEAESKEEEEEEEVTKTLIDQQSSRKFHSFKF
jgi:hypothetical protein